MIDTPCHLIATHATPLGPMWSRWSERGLFQLDWNTSPETATEGAMSHAHADRLDELLREYFETGVTCFDEIAIDPSGWTDFSSRIYQSCRQVGAGSTVTYKQLADAAGNVNASRAVGAAMSRNRVLVVIPCHRVVSAGGDLRGFSAPGGLQTKRSLLELERTGVWPVDLLANA